MSEFHQQPNVFVNHVTIKVQELKRSIPFYKNIVGFQVLEQSETKAVLTANGTTPLLTLEKRGEVVPKLPRTTGLYHFAILLPNRKELGKFINHLTEQRFQITGAANHEISEALYFNDPEGNGIEVYCDTPPSSWRWQNGLIRATNSQLDFESIAADAKGELWTGLPQDTLMGHIHLHVSDIKKAERFYHQGLGLDVVIRMGDHALFFSTGGYHHHIGVNIWNGTGAPQPQINSVGLQNFTINFPNEKAKQTIVQNLQSLQYSVSQIDGNYVTKDPSGNEIILACSS